MASLKELKNRIGSVKSTQKITKAKQMVAAAKLRRAQEAAEAAKPYAKRMANVVANLTSAMDGSLGPRLLAGTGDDQVHLLIVVTAERGLCGGFNANCAKLARQTITALQNDGKTIKVLTVGKKGREALKSDFSDLFIDHVDLSEAKDDFAPFAIGLGKDLAARFDAGEFDIATIIFSEFQNVLVQSPKTAQLIPAVSPDDADLVDLRGAIYAYEPSETEILEVLLPRYLTTQILSAMLENIAGEQAASMTAMDNATRNAGDLINKLTLQYNRARQAQITKELIEIISGAEAL
ncbi:MAG: F0F1 ATP synthase subunit gamma [Hyphomonadaceae bacterium]|nr:F0F1 ATP synthase subunit gamma [Hyphomonadaceae bacterium]OUX94541.1 MAG: F0F1 ATP synthase subunit gamma [Hyphomonas sp. TMED17]CAI8342666.1 MAG: ATP synthase gamma chain [Hyphomonas sp. TMED17]